MSKISEQIRKAALGPTPESAFAVSSWLPGKAWDHALGALENLGDWWASSNDTRRTFLLLVAESLS